jgi:hypothetical protein
MKPCRRASRRLAALLAVILTGAMVASADITAAFLEDHWQRLDTLFRQLDPLHPSVGPIRADWEAGRALQAAAALDAYYAAKDFPLDMLDPAAIPADLLEHADAAVAGRFLIIEEWETLARRPDGGPDWHDRGARRDKERAWMLNRHPFLPVLAEAYLRTGDRRYKEALNSLWRDWILHNPYPDRLTFSPPWRALEVARRILGAWVHAFYAAAVIEPETRLLALCSILDHGDALREHASFWGGNHLITEKLALLTLSTAWPELAPAAQWRDYAIDRVSRQLRRQTYPDGSYMELSNHYQRVVLFNARYFLRLLAMHDSGFRDLPVVETIERMWDFHAAVMRPDGHGPLSNASDQEHNASQVLSVWEFHDRPDWLYIATSGAQGRRPTGTPSRLFPWAGQAILRSGWDRDAHWIYFDAGPYGTAHQHVDRFQVSASLNGEPLLVDTGRHTYQPGKWKDYFQGPEGHNVLLLDERPAQQGPRKVSRPLPVAFLSRDGVSFTAASSAFRPDGFAGFSLRGPVPWTRAVLLDHRGFALILDHLVTFRDHALRANWHFAPGVSPETAGRALRLASPRQLLDRGALVGAEHPRPRGFFSPQYNRRVPITLLHFNGRIDRPTTLVWILQPPDTPAVEVVVLSDPGAPVLRLRLQQDARHLASVEVQLHPQPVLLRYDPGP